MEKIKNVLLVIFSLAIVILGLHWWGTKEIKSQESAGIREAVKEGDKEFMESAHEESEGAGAKENEQFHVIGAVPEVKVFQTDYNKGTQIVFNHKNHVEGYNLECIQCHHVENCNKCHLKNKGHKMEVEEGKVALHENCWKCHAELEAGPRKCDECHKQ